MTKEDDVSKISTSVFVTSFPDSFTAKDLFHTCKIYGHVVDSFIPSKRSREGKRFGFVRFINVFNAERLVSNLCTIWVGRYKLQANLARFNRTVKQDNFNSSKPIQAEKYGVPYRNNSFAPSKGVGFKVNGNSFASVLSGKDYTKKPVEEVVPAIVLDDDCLYTKDMSKSLLGRVKEVTSLTNLKKALINEGFDDLTMRYMGELWVLLEFNSVKSKDLFTENIGVGSWFLELKQASNDFLTEGRIIWVEVEGVPLKVWSVNTFKKIAAKWGELLDIDDEEDIYLHSKRLCILTKLSSNIFENFKIVYRGMVCLIRAKEVPGWVPDFLEDSDNESQSEEDINDQEPLVHDVHSGGDENEVREENEVNEVPETQFDKPANKDGSISPDPFGIYPILNKDKKDGCVNGTDDDDSIKYPPGFTPDGGNRDSHLCEENFSSINGEEVQQGNEGEIPGIQNGSRSMNGTNSQVSGSVGSRKFKKSVVPKTGGSMLCLMEELVRVGQAMGYNMEGCVKNMSEIIDSQGAEGVYR
ncbi:nucleotide-binding alpha-beta plait domain-containing protein [Tanacetum coccineum]